MKIELKNPLENFKMKIFNVFFLGLFIFQRNGMLWWESQLELFPIVFIFWLSLKGNNTSLTIKEQVCNDHYPKVQLVGSFWFSGYNAF